jgi:hypothetical protein
VTWNGSDYGLCFSENFDAHQAKHACLSACLPETIFSEFSYEIFPHIHKRTALDSRRTIEQKQTVQERDFKKMVIPAMAHR